MNDWKKYPDNRLIMEHPAGFFIIKPEELDRGQPLACPVCDAFMTSFYDDESYQKFECCDRCSSAWARPRQEQWKAGWRPSREEVLNKFGEVDI